MADLLNSSMAMFGNRNARLFCFSSLGEVKGEQVKYDMHKAVRQVIAKALNYIV
jgi:hypothetical protein